MKKNYSSLHGKCTKTYFLEIASLYLHQTVCKIILFAQQVTFFFIRTSVALMFDALSNCIAGIPLFPNNF